MRFSKSKKAVLYGAVGLLVALGIVAWVMTRSSAVPPKPAPVAATIEWPHEEVIGTSVEGRAITAYTYGSGAMKILFVGGMHGGYEWNSVMLAYQFMDYLKAHPTLVASQLSIAVIPALNPDGLYKVVGTTGRFSAADASTDAAVLASGRFNAHGVDLNRNFACHWQAKSMWKGREVSEGTAAFSEPESQALRAYVLAERPVVVVFWHSQANAVYASECDEGILPLTTTSMNAYAKAAGYPAVASFDAYPITGDSEGWLASIGIPAITVELQTHTTIEWDKNLAGIKALLASVPQ
ncbi:hypothetical protein COU19_02865 [Candidatus Kaiserbacteria bacterium CG10_big_fil_rev_8_21_14_0_10_56_12]|uniref:Peptidase M14 domain-containing protein n=1 Tax=Candidatus Kaiserbacteria bacterium CG10_big_fil_rev_8_21_14_0_10_56_12 TaxID=1974611 RepID=A0A2H0U989_9BACT|nr:MAG: hypothetical protein COU19_02865 [Candidatus Kaiserbacteria bacterium CG10_big_fil_rev_8_21_14_0_10_56_12]